MAIFAVAALAALAFGLSSYFGEEEVPQVTVPTVVDKPEQTAIAELARAGLEVDVVRQASDTVPADVVISQTPQGWDRGRSRQNRAPRRVLRPDRDRRARPRRQDR